MNDNILSTRRSDLFGSMASTLCMLHCIATPFVFIAQTAHASCGSLGPWWWHALDFIFLLIGFFAIRRSQQTSSLTWIAKAMYVSWSILTLLILNNKMALLPITGWLIYLPACSLVALHLYNMKYCKCESENCSVHSE